MRRTIRIGVVLAGVCVLLAGGIAAWAAWGVHGLGATRAKGGQSSPLVVVAATTSPATLLYPGGNGDMSIRIRNNNPFPVNIATVVRTANPITSNHAGCPGSILRMTEEDQMFDVDWSLGPGAEETFTLPQAVHMDISAGNACQGASFAIPVTIFAVST